ncbi:hypothetical protein COB55_05425 [Candidatus Wolfebacteria bacterium]|nr:MAG: hypothetical protein COB55_05425 [Candidatus Wolfebacteria bacterium]
MLYKTSNSDIKRFLVQLDAHEWGLGLAGLSEVDLERGLAKCRAGNKWPPNLPEFRAMCEVTPEEFGLPSESAAYREACLNAGNFGELSWSHPAVYHAYQDVGSWQLRNSREQRSKPMFHEAYNSRVGQVMRGAKLQIPEHKLLAKKEKTFSSAENEAAYRACMSKLGRLAVSL